MDGATIHFMGTCTYTLSQHRDPTDVCYYNVETTLEERDNKDGVSFNKRIDVQFGQSGVIYSLLKDRVVLVCKHTQLLLHSHNLPLVVSNNEKVI